MKKRHALPRKYKTPLLRTSRSDMLAPMTSVRHSEARIPVSSKRTATPIPHNMADRIAAELDAIEQAHGVRVLYACESGSRAWGFASEDSDYDVRFVYVREPEWYLRLEQGRNVIEWVLDEVLDINGWDLAKALRLMRTSNPSVFEWLDSPIVYRETGTFSAVRDPRRTSFAPKPAVYHYLNMARKNRAEHLSAEHVRLKKYLYVMRSLLAARWVARRRTPPPVPFAELVDAELESGVKLLFSELVRQKTGVPEGDLVPRIPELDKWIESTYQEIDASVLGIPAFDKPDWDPYDRTFLDVLGVRRTLPR